MSRVIDLESYVLSNLYTNCPYYTGNSWNHIKPTAIGHIILSAPNVYPRYDKKGNVSGYYYTHKVNSRGLMNYAYLLNEYGSVNLKYFPRYKHWANKAIYNACVMYANKLKGEGYDAVVINKLGL